MQHPSPTFTLMAQGDIAALVDFLTREPWPMFSFPMTTHDEVMAALDEGLYVGPDVRTWWVADADRLAGFVMATGLGARLHPPELTIRLDRASRGRGLGRAAVAFATHQVFEGWPATRRFTAATRVDNAAMRRTFEACDWVLEGVERSGWIEPSTGAPVDAVRYSITRADWASGSVTGVDWPSVLG